MPLTSKHHKTLKSICDTLIPSLIPEKEENTAFWKAKASDLNVPKRLAELIKTRSPKEQREFALFLSLLEQPIFTLLHSSGFRGISDISSEENKEQLVLRLASHPIADIRKGFSAVKKLCTFLFYSELEDGSPNPFRTIMNYPIPPIEGKLPEPSVKVFIPESNNLSCEVLVIGSGAGGGVAAAELSAAGKDVIVAEKGSYFSEREFTRREGEMTAALYEDKGLLSNTDADMIIFAGSCLGGGTTVNWSACFRTPDYILQEWADEHDFPEITGKDYQESMDFVWERMSVSKEVIRHSPQNNLLLNASERMGHKTAEIPQNQLRPEGTDGRLYGYSGLGCRSGLKQGSMRTFLKDAHKNGVRIVCNAEAEKILIKNGKAVGAEFLYQEEEKSRRVTIKAEKVVVAAGAIHTPALLMRSGISHPVLGKNLFLHPVIAASGFYKEEISPWHYMAMTATNDEFTRLDGNYGFKIETPPVHPGLMALGMPWQSAKKHKEIMQKAAHAGTFIALLRDRHGGNVRLQKNGKPKIHYRLHPYDLNHLLKAAEEMARLHLKAGAEKVMIMHNEIPSIRSENDIQRFIRKAKWSKYRFMLFSAHQMGSCRMGGIRKGHVLNPEGRLWDIPNLFVADASVFPKCSGVNPMITVMALAHRISGFVKA